MVKVYTGLKSVLSPGASINSGITGGGILSAYSLCYLKELFMSSHLEGGIAIFFRVDNSFRKAKSFV